jgi:hypothetical protein
MTIQNRELSGFDRVNWKGVGRLTIEQGDRESVTVEAPDRIIDTILTEVRGGELLIRHEWSWKSITFIPGETIAVRVVAKEVREVKCAGAGTATGLNLKTEALSVELSGAGSLSIGVDVSALMAKVSGAGSLTVSGQADRQEVTLSGVGSYKARQLQSREASVRVSGAGGAEVNVSERLEATINGVGAIRYLGNPEVREHTPGLGKVSRL